MPPASCLLALVSLTGLISPATAHTLKTDADVGATFHLEPNHNPRAGEVATVWFALTRSGGQIIPLEQCNCQLAIYQQPSTPEDSPVLQPPLKAISAEQYQGIPGAEIVFPQAGAYELELSGTPQAGAEFQPFQLKYNINVSVGKAAPEVSSAQENSNPESQVAQKTASSESAAPFPSQSVVVLLILTLVLGIGGLWFVRRNAK
ncbi:MAG: hypothetical protein F6K41_38760 [Symploca sp. SIO3E6]|nr:hypothetical protein [Caldora sp. SIO3E6]